MKSMANTIYLEWKNNQRSIYETGSYWKPSVFFGEQTMELSREK